MEEVVYNEQNPEVMETDNGPTTRPDNGELQPLVDHCMTLYDEFSKSEYRAKKKREIELSRLAYEQEPDPAAKNWPWPDAYNIVMPLLAVAVDNLEPRLVAGLVGKDPVLLFDMKDKIVPGVTPQALKTCENWYNGELRGPVAIDLVARNIIHTLLLEGTHYSIPRYRLDKTIRKDFLYNEQGQMIPHPVSGLPRVKEVQETVADGGSIESIPFDDILCADNLGTIEEWEKGDKIRIVRFTYGDLMRSRNLLGYMPDMIGPWLVAEKGKRVISEEDKSESQKVAGVEVTGNETIRCGEFHITYYTKKVEEKGETEQVNFEEEKIVVLIALDSKTILRIVKLRDLNWMNESIIKRIRLFPEEGRSFGSGFYSKIKGIQEGSTAFLNSALNYADLVMLPWYMHSTGAGPTTDEPIEPGKGIEVEDIQKILFPKFTTEGGLAFQWLEFLINLNERITSVANPQIGRPDEKGKTATEILSVVQEGNIKFNYQSKTTKDEFVALLATLYDLYYQYMPLNKQFSYKGEVVQIPRPALRRNYSFSLTSSTETANKLIERKEAEDLFNIAQASPLFNPMETGKDLLKAYGKSEAEIGRYLNPNARALFDMATQNPELVQVCQQYLMSKQNTMNEITGGQKPPKQLPPGGAQ